MNVDDSNACDLIEDEEDWDDLRERGESILPAHFEKNPKLFISSPFFWTPELQ